MIGNIITTENTPVRRIGIEWYLFIINTAFTIFLPEPDILDGSLFSLLLLLWMFCWVFSVGTIWWWCLYESHCDTDRPTIQVSLIFIRLGLLLLKHDVIKQILYFSATSQHAMIGSSRHSFPVPYNVCGDNQLLNMNHHSTPALASVQRPVL